jgi:uncharacterized protein (DUF433 family)
VRSSIAILSAARSRRNQLVGRTREIGSLIVDPAVMGGKPCCRSPRITLGAVLGLIASGVCCLK